ncbi:thiamine phosphate synthase [Candidatus Magnetominusculus dajiuhuensis]|uniref:thiamine phosphate synthase n=1 Tax=Candidatus Magnetominusculus dajiuhuensis TaxID=3137712 RepID=UPI003B430532
MANLDFKLMLITGASDPARALLTAVGEALRAGVKAVQLREKSISAWALMGMAVELRHMTRQYGALLFINDRVDIALCAEADGVQLGEKSIPIDAARRLAGGKLLIGKSTHSLDEAFEARRKGADYLLLGPIYHTPSKAQYGEPIGLDIIQEVKHKVKLPVFAVGGIKPQHVEEVMEFGADGIAVISGILSSDNISVVTEKYLELLK